MKTISRYIMTLALLITAVGGAWADETLLLTINSRDYESFTDGSKTFDDKVTVTFSDEVRNSGDDWGWYARSSASLLTVAGTNGYTITSCKFYTEVDGDAITGYTIAGESPSVYLSDKNVYTDANQSVFIGAKGVTKIEVYGTAPNADPAIKVTTNAAEEGATFTEASFAMPAFDATAEYELVRDMGYKVAFSGVPTRARLAKDGNGKFHFADGLTFQLLDNIDAANPKDITSAEGITFMVGEVEAFDFEGNTFYQLNKATLVPLADFLADAHLGNYAICAVASTGEYDGTVYSSKFTVVEEYDLTVKPANDFSKGKIESVTVGSGSVTIDANTGEATKTGIDPGTEVKIKAKRGYVIEKVEVKKAGPALKTLTVNGVATKSIYYVEGDNWQQAIERPENEGSGWRVQDNYIFNGGYTLLIGSGYVRPGHTIDATKNYSLQAD